MFPPRSPLVSSREARLRALSCTTCPFAGICALLRASCPSVEFPSPPAPLTRLPQPLPTPPLQPPPEGDMSAELDTKEQYNLPVHLVETRLVLEGEALVS